MNKYELYFLPTRVVKEYKAIMGDNKYITTPIIKRKVSAAINATKDTREELSEDLYIHRFGKLEIILERNTKTVRKINEINPIEIDNKIGCVYGKVCKYFGLNQSRKGFKRY